MSVTIPLPSWRCHKVVQALKIAAIIPNPRGVELHFDDQRFCPIEVGDAWVNKHAPQPGGYLVVYPGDGYRSWSPADAFEAGYTPVDDGQQPSGNSGELPAAAAPERVPVHEWAALHAAGCAGKNCGATDGRHSPECLDEAALCQGWGDFGHALRALKAGHRVARSGWNGKGMWLAYSPGSKALPAEKFWAGPNRDYAAANGGTADVLPCITMKTATGEVLMGWLASQTDMLAEDWCLVGGDA